MSEKHFSLDMTVADALQTHPWAVEVFAAFRLGGCALCHIAHIETLEQVCANYGIDADRLLEMLEGLMEAEPA